MNIYIFKIILIILFIVISFPYIIYENFNCCLRYNKNIGNINFKCPVELIFNGLNVLSDEETLDEIIINNKSISRFGDGEFNLIFGIDVGFQNYNKKLSKKLRHILKCQEKDLLVGINIPYKNEHLFKYTDKVKNYYVNWVEKNKCELSRVINKNKLYSSSEITRFYFEYKDKEKIPNYIKKLKKIWDRKDVLIIEGEMSRLGINNDLFNNTKSIKRIICPSENAFDKYDKIINEVIKFDKKNLILIALGPTATVLTYDLYKLGYQAVDVGHIDIEYEWYLRNATKKCQIENKYVNEALGKKYNFTKIKNKEYYNQIISKILKFV